MKNEHVQPMTLRASVQRLIDQWRNPNPDHPLTNVDRAFRHCADQLAYVLALSAVPDLPGGLETAWQPIESALKDTLVMIAYGKGSDVVTEGALDANGQWRASTTLDGIVQPTAWRPLPAPPTQAEVDRLRALLAPAKEK